MEEWSDRVKSSPAYQKATELRALLDTLNPNDYAADIRNHLERIELVVESVLDRLENSDPRLVNPAALNNIGSYLANAISNVNYWLNGSGETYLVSSAQSDMDNVLSQLMIIGPSQDTPEARESIAKLRRSVAGHTTAVDKLIKQIEAKGSVADETIDQKVTEAQAEFTRLQKEVTDLDTELTEIKNTGAQVNTEQQKAYTKAEADRTAEFAKLLSDKQKELDEALKTHNKTAAEAIETIRKSVEDDEQKASDARQRIEEILGIVGEDALVTDYAKSARNELITSTIWQIVTSLSIVGAIGFAIKFSNSVDDSTTWQHLVSKVVIVLAFGGLAGYAAKQASEHRVAQRNSERMALQLKALKPYLNDIEDAKTRDDLLVKVAEKIFAASDEYAQIVDEKGNPILTAQLVEALIELAKKVSK